MSCPATSIHSQDQRNYAKAPTTLPATNQGCYNRGCIPEVHLIELNIPNRGTIQLNHLVCDVNGTLAVDGRLIEGVSHKLSMLRDRLQVHLLTADTHGQQKVIDAQLGLTAVRIPAGDEAGAKADYIRELGPEQVVAIGQGANDAGMLKEAAIGIAIFSAEGLSSEALHAADLFITDIHSAFNLLEKPIRLVATLRS
jgi:P-type E1-E2 ATPase